MVTTLHRQESEVAQELKLALEEACLEAGVALSPAIFPSVSCFPIDACWLFDENHWEPGARELAGWLSITRRRSYRPSPLNKFRKYALPSSEVVETLGEQPEEEIEDQRSKSSTTTKVDEDKECTPQEMSLKQRLGNAMELDVLAPDFNWGNLRSVHRTEHAESDPDEQSDARDSFGSVEVTVNSGGVVYFALFQSSHHEVGCGEPSVDGENKLTSEAAAVFKFGSSRLATQSERLGMEIARHLGVATPQARVIHSSTPEWNAVQHSVEIVKSAATENENEIGTQTCEELLEALRLSRCMLIMGYIHGKPLAETPGAFSPEKIALKTAAALGRTLVLDLILSNEDRLVCRQLRWRGNPGNLLVAENAPHGSHKLGPPSVETTATIALLKSKFLNQNRSQSARNVRSALPKVPRAPSPELEAKKYHSLKSFSVAEEEKAPAAIAEAATTKKETEAKVEGNECMLVAIDSGVSRRPPRMKMEQDRRVYAKTVELLLNDDKVAANLLREISFGHLGAPVQNTLPTSPELEPLRDESNFAEEIDYSKVTKAFQGGVAGGIRDMQILRMFLVKLFRTLDHLLRDFVAFYTSKQQHDNATSVSNSKSPERRASDSPSAEEPGPECTPSTEDSSSDLLTKTSPVRENWHGTGSPGRLTRKLKDVSRTAKTDDEVSKNLEWWDDKLRVEGQKLCRAHGFTTGFLDDGGGSHSLVDSYELKVRLEPILERMTLISAGSDSERPSRVLPHLYIGNALAARSVHTLQHLGITHILCLCPSDLDATNAGDFPHLFKYQHYAVKDVEDENIAAYFEGACLYVEAVEAEGGKALVHCFEGKSRSATVVLAYLMLRKGYTLAQAWSTLKAVHRRTQPNDGFMKTLVQLDVRLHGKASMSFLQRRPTAQKCPVCDKFAGFSVTSFHQHFRRAHPGIPLPPALPPVLT